MNQQFAYDDILDFWFPDDGHWEDAERHVAFWQARMRGGMDAAIRRDFAPMTEAAARGDLDHWADSPRGRLALIVVLDQFPRSLWRDTPAAFAQDIRAARLALDGIGNGHCAALDAPWEREFYAIAISHCEGPDHAERMEPVLRLTEENAALLPPQLAPMGVRSIEQANRVRDVIRRFGRHPHRNVVLGRPSTSDEARYIATGDFPHARKLDAESVVRS